MMLSITRNIIIRNANFATARIRPRKQKNSKDNESDSQDVFKAYRKQVEKSSILRQFREDVFRRAELAEDWGRNKKNLKEQATIEKLMEGDRQEMLQRASHFEARAIQRRSPLEQNTGRSLVSDYGNYKAYDKVHPVILDRNMGENEFLEDSHATKNYYKFIDKLPDEYAEKEQLQAVINRLPVNQQKMTIAEYGEKLQKKMNDAQRTQWKRFEDHKIHDTHRYAVRQDTPEQDTVIDQDYFDTSPEEYHNFTGVPRTLDPDNNEEGLEAALSPKAIDTIYELYLQGWSVRDISKRFGILPGRAKFYVWVRAQLYHEVIPKMGVKYYLRALRLEQRFNENVAFCDYGLDINRLSNDSILNEVTEWNSQMLDAQRKQQPYFGAMKYLQKTKQFTRYQMVEVGTFDKENSKYRLKQWKIFRGKGSDEYFLRNHLLKDLTKAQKKFTTVYY